MISCFPRVPLTSDSPLPGSLQRGIFVDIKNKPTAGVVYHNGSVFVISAGTRFYAKPALFTELLITLSDLAAPHESGYRLIGYDDRRMRRADGPLDAPGIRRRYTDSQRQRLPHNR